MSTFGDHGNSASRERKPLPDCVTRLLRYQDIEACDLARSTVPAAVGGSNRKSYANVLAATWVQLDRLAELAGSRGAATSSFARRR
jgi:hypothetical protein